MIVTRWDSPGRIAPRADEGDARAAWVPAVEILERRGDLVIRAEVPGLDASGIEIRVEDDRLLLLRGEREREAGLDETSAYRLERSFGAISRSFLLPETVDTTGIRASCRDGLLEILLPKIEAAKPRKIAIAAS